MATHFVHDVPADGNCFYHCIIRTCGDLLGIHSVPQLRATVAEQIRSCPLAQIDVSHLLQLLNQCPEMQTEFPLIEARDRSEHGYASLAHAVEQDQTWASQVEHNVVQRLLEGKGVALITLDCKSHSDLTEECDVEEQLLKALHVHCKKYCAVLVQIANNHYMYISLCGAKLIDTKMLKSYIETFLQSDSE